MKISKRVSRHPRRATAQGQVLVTGVMIVLLATFLVTGMTENRERAARARCLANLRQLAAGAQAYAIEDSLNQAVPLHASMLRTVVSSAGWSSEWNWRTAARFAYGGQTATLPFSQSTTTVPGNFTSVMLDPNGNWGAASRPLNPYIVGSLDNNHLEGLDAFRCPVDQGYPDNILTSNREIPLSTTGVPCIDLLGNSYGIRGTGFAWASGGSIAGRFSIGSTGHRLDSLVDTGRLLLFYDSTFGAMTRGIRTTPSTTPAFSGWHGQEYADNAAYTDGSARLTIAGDLYNGWDVATLQEMNYSDPNGGVQWSWFLSRGRTWRIDCFPTPGARIAMRNAAGTIVTPNPNAVFPPTARTRWPFVNFQDVTP